MLSLGSSSLPSFNLDGDTVGEQVLTSLSNLVAHLGRLGVDGPRHLRNPSLAGRGEMIGQGAQFEVFRDKVGAMPDVVFKRVRLDRLYGASVTLGLEALSHLKTIELEIRSLCDPVRRSNRNIVDLISWGYDYPTSDLRLRIPVLIVERALCSLEDALTTKRIDELGFFGSEIPHYLSLDIAAGLRSVHESNLAHGDLKPANILIFRQDNQQVPYIAKLSDFGSCIALENECLTYASYRGTEGWRPPEITLFESSVSESPLPYLDPQKLVRCDSYVYGLVIVSLFLSCARPTRGTRLSQVEVQSANLADIFTKLNLPSRLLQRLQTVAEGLLSMTPELRPDISPDLLLCDVDSSKTWLESRRGTGIEHAVRGWKNPDHNCGYAYYSKLDPSSLLQLEGRYRVANESEKARWSNETLFGMAIGAMKLAEPGYRARAVEYAVASARLSYVPAQAIVQRLLDAVSQRSTLASPDEIEGWLFNGASEGSLTAIEDLRKINSEKAQLARLEFVRNGGYCKPLSRARYESAMTHVADKTDLKGWIDDDGNSLLHYAVAFGNEALIDHLLALGTQVNSMNRRGETPLYLACLAGDATAVSKLVACKAEASICAGAHGISCLHWLFNFDKDEQRNVAKLLHKSGGSPCKCTLPVKDQNFLVPITWAHFPFHWPHGTPMHWACFARSPTACDALLALGADINDVDGVGDSRAQTSLAMAAYRGDSFMVQHLLSRGADPKKLDQQGCSPAHMLAISSVRMNRLCDMSLSLKWWTYHGSWETHQAELARCVTSLSSAGWAIDGATRHISERVTQTPIMDAAEDANSGPLLALLIGGSSTTSTREFTKESLLHVWLGHDSRRGAYKNAFAAATEALLKQQDAIVARDYQGRTILHSCLDAPYEEDFREFSTLFLSKASFLLETQDDNGCTPLLQAVRIKVSDDDDHPAVSRSNWLCDRGADMTVLDHEGCGLLMHACDNDQLSDRQCLGLVQRMLQAMPHAERLAHVRSSKSHKTLRTPLMCACDNSFLEVVKYLVNLMEDINKLSNSRLTALDIAINQALYMRQKQLLRWLIDGIIKWNMPGSYFQPLFRRFSRDSLHSRDLVFKDTKAMEALFQTPYTEGDCSSRVRRKMDASLAAKYFDCIDVIRLLRMAGAVQAKDICSDPGVFHEYGPRERDESFIENFNGELDPGFTKAQPFLHNHWDLLYDILQD